ncbi:MAG: MerR family DNA-binding transcriptional regulator, partial [Hydrogenophaga sp.]
VPMPNIRVSEAARLLGVSDDTIRRWTENGSLTPLKDDAGRRAVDGLELARLAREQAQLPDDPAKAGSSARNRFVGLVTNITADKVMAAAATLRAEFQPISDMRASAHYRQTVLGNLLQRFWLESQGLQAINLESLTASDLEATA